MFFSLELLIHIYLFIYLFFYFFILFVVKSNCIRLPVTVRVSKTSVLKVPNNTINTVCALLYLRVIHDLLDDARPR